MQSVKESMLSALLRHPIFVLHLMRNNDRMRNNDTIAQIIRFSNAILLVCTLALEKSLIGEKQV